MFWKAEKNSVSATSLCIWDFYIHNGSILTTHFQNLKFVTDLLVCYFVFQVWNLVNCNLKTSANMWIHIWTCRLQACKFPLFRYLTTQLLAPHVKTKAGVIKNLAETISPSVQMCEIMTISTVSTLSV